MTCNSLTPLNDAGVLHISTPKAIQPLSKRSRPRKPLIRQPERQRREMEVLRKEMTILQDILDHPQSKADPQPRTNAQKAFVKRYLKERLHSETQQKWLQTAISGKITLISDLLALVYQHLRTASVLTVQSQGLYDGVILQPTDELLYAMYIYELDSIYAQTDEVFQSCGMDPTEETTSFQQMTLTTNGEAVSTQNGWKQFFPFNFKHTCDSMWMLSHILNRQDEREAFSDVAGSQNTLAIKFRVTRCVDENENEALYQRFVLRRFVDKDREITVWKASIVGDGEYRGMQMDQIGWSVLRPLREGTLAEVCVRQVPLHLRSAEEVSQPTAKRFHDFVQDMVRENSEEVTAMAKALLLENALNGIHV